MTQDMTETEARIVRSETEIADLRAVVGAAVDRQGRLAKRHETVEHMLTGAVSAFVGEDEDEGVQSSAVEEEARIVRLEATMSYIVDLVDKITEATDDHLAGCPACESNRAALDHMAELTRCAKAG